MTEARDQSREDLVVLSKDWSEGDNSTRRGQQGAHRPRTLSSSYSSVSSSVSLSHLRYGVRKHPEVYNTYTFGNWTVNNYTRALGSPKR